jgi:hypothetical protein
VSYAPVSSRDQVRHRCRNPRCRTKLAAAVENRNLAFCCPSCRAVFYRRRCVVCERSTRSERAITCGRTCLNTHRRQPEIYPTPGHPTALRRADSGSAHSTGLKTRPPGGRAWRIIAGPEVPALNLEIGLDPKTAARQERDRLAVQEHRRQTKRAAARKEQIKRHRPPVNILGGYRFPDAPVLDLSPPPVALSPAVFVFTTDDPFEIPAFLDRRSTPEAKARLSKLKEAA